MGNSPDQSFLGPEVPGRAADAEDRFKDRGGRMKRQGARFRVYGYDENGQVVQELTTADAAITWTVHLVNAKAAWYEFVGAANDTPGAQLPWRNADIVDEARTALIIDPGPRTITGPRISGTALFDTGTFLGQTVPLGELRTDEAGRLIVLGGFGTSASTDGRKISDFANNDRWHDDVSDGPVTAHVVLTDGREIAVNATSWVIVTPPDFAPAVGNLVSLYDVQVALSKTKAAQRVSFTHDIYPILARVVGLRWVNALSRRGHGPGSPGDFLSPDNIAKLSDPARAKSFRQKVFERLRNPNLSGDAAVTQANLNYMPQLSGDGGFTTQDEPATWFTLLPHQYDMMRRWAIGEFDADWDPTTTVEVPQSVAALDPAEQPAALDRASMEACVGGPFFPGIEMTYIARDPSIYCEPHRLRPDLQPGDLTKRMALPWQADFYDCRERWWPAQRPDDVITEAEYHSVIAALSSPDGTGDHPPIKDLQLSTRKWARGLGEQPIRRPDGGYSDMVQSWTQMGVLRPRKLPNGQDVLVEGDRPPYFGLKDRDYFHIMLNIESYPDFLPTARELTDRFLAAARALQASSECPDVYRPFSYSIDVLRSRLDQIYTQEAQAADRFSVATPSDSGELWTKEMLHNRLVQMAPFNQTDGAWLRHAGEVGPIDEVHALLFHVWMDELGNGDPKLSHANIYTDLLHDAGIYLEPVTSRAYVENPAIVDAAFTLPLFELTISQFPDEYLPEILGMTLYLEWAVVGLKPQAELLEAFGFNPMFYRLHIGIDNATTGHGAMARRAVELYMDEVRATSGDKVMQEVWRRVWDGYVAFATTGELGEYFRRANTPQNPDTRVKEMIQRKAHFGSQNHGAKQLGDNSIQSTICSQTPAASCRRWSSLAASFPAILKPAPFSS